MKINLPQSCANRVPVEAPRRRSWRNWVWRGLVLILLSARAPAGELSFSIAGPGAEVAPGSVVRLWLNAINPWSDETPCSFPVDYPVRLRMSGAEQAGTLQLLNPAEAGEVRVAPQKYARREYSLQLPERASGQVWVTIPSLPGTAVVVAVAPPSAPPPAAPAPKTEVQKVREQFKATPPEPVEYFKRHFFPYEPFYFVAGPDSPNAKFQISFKYRLIDERSGLAERAGFTTNFFVAYTQTSLWDWNAASAPFEDSSYKPELMYLWERIVGRGPDQTFRFDLQGGVQHESNGRDGAASRSLNLAYLRPTLIFGPEAGWQFKFDTRAWIYLPDLDDNRDLPRYRGHFDLRMVLGPQDGLQLAALVRVGDGFDKGSLQLDLTYPLRQIRWAGFTWCLQAQYFVGYGESLLHYNDYSTAYRFGFSIYR